MLISTINHTVRKQLGLGCFQYIILDVLYQLNVSSALFIGACLSAGEVMVKEKLKDMADMEPALVKQVNDTYEITEYARMVISGSMLVKEKPKRIKHHNELADVVIEMFNTINGTRYAVLTYSNLIDNIYKHDKTLTSEHFEAVIKHKAATWGQDPKMGEYNRPKTLFGSPLKFMIYLDDARMWWTEQSKKNADYSDIGR